MATSEGFELASNIVKEKRNETVENTEIKHRGATRVLETVNVDQYLVSINEFGKGQKLIILILCFMMFPASGQYFMMTFIGDNPPWSCVKGINGTNCDKNGTFSVGDDYYEKRCSMKLSYWNFTKLKKYSIVTEVRISLTKDGFHYFGNTENIGY